ncbi:MAG: trypsin-like peptidase domain-containing protein [Gemmatimonadaceae bacterium]|nr:trypsin-like peptidase domain-containing protein [Gemmatimonadaceae bacterium]
MRVRSLLIPLLLAAAAAAEDPVTASRRNAVVRAVERVQPSVVSVRVVHREQVRRYRHPLELLFRDPFGPRYYRGHRDRVLEGSGFIVDSEGFVLTNAHLLGRRGIRKVEVSLPDGRVFQVRSGSRDVALDLAVLEIEGGGLPVAPLARSDHLLVGEWAIAIGNPFDLGPTVSIGVISAVDRDFEEPQGDYYYRDMIQTDAAINPGNSGGPLVNALGEVVGVNSFIYTGGEYSLGSIGIGFAIPIGNARRFLDEMRVHGEVRRPWHGIVDLQDLTPRWASYLKLDAREGAVVMQVTVDSPAYEADLDRYDVIVGINGEAVGSASEARSVLGGLRVDQTCALEIIRSNEPRTIEFRIRERPKVTEWN